MILSCRGENQNSSGLDHFGTCQGIAAQLIISGAQNVVLNHSDNVDISAEINGMKIAFEYERPGIHTQAQLFEKKERAEKDYDRVVFIAQKATLSSYKKHAEKEMLFSVE